MESATTQPSVMLALSSNLLRFETATEQATLAHQGIAGHGIQIKSQLVQNSRDEFVRVLQITLHDRVFTIRDSFRAVQCLPAQVAPHSPRGKRTTPIDCLETAVKAARFGSEEYEDDAVAGASTAMKRADSHEHTQVSCWPEDSDAAAAAGKQECARAKDAAEDSMDDEEKCASANRRSDKDDDDDDEDADNDEDVFQPSAETVYSPERKDKKDGSGVQTKRIRKQGGGRISLLQHTGLAGRFAHRSGKRDRKNLVKNFVKAFRSFVNCVVDDEVVRDIKQFTGVTAKDDLERFRSEFEAWISPRNFNNQLIVDLVRSDLYGDLFEFFLQERARDWIQTSKIHDKSAHMDALQEYLAAVKQERGLARVRVLKFRKCSSASATGNLTNAPVAE